MSFLEMDSAGSMRIVLAFKSVPATRTPRRNRPAATEYPNSVLSNSTPIRSPFPRTSAPCSGKRDWMSRSPARKYSPAWAAWPGRSSSSVTLIAAMPGARDRPRLARHRPAHHGGDVQPHIARFLELPLHLVGVAELDEIDILQERLEGDPVLRLAHERQRAVRLAVEPANRGDESGFLGVEAGQLHGPLDRVGAVIDEEAFLEISRGDLPQELGQSAAQRIEQLLARERHPIELVPDRLDNLRVPHPGAVDSEAAQAVDVLPTHDVFDVGAGSPLRAPFPAVFPAVARRTFDRSTTSPPPPPFALASRFSVFFI